MLKTIEGTLDEHGTVHLNEHAPIDTPRRILVTILPPERKETPETRPERVIGVIMNEEWNNSEEDAAWAHLETEK